MAFHRAIGIEFKEGVVVEATFQDGKVIQYDMAELYGKYPQLRALEDRELFTSGYTVGGYGVVWNDDLDIEMETIYQEGTTVRRVEPAHYVVLGEAVWAARAEKDITRKELGKIVGVDPEVIHDLEKGIAKPPDSIMKKLSETLETEFEFTTNPEEVQP